MCEQEIISKNSDCNLFSECSNCQQDISCFRKTAGVLSDSEIRQLNLMPDAKNENFNPTIYDLSLGSFHYVYGVQQAKSSTRKSHNKKGKRKGTENEEILKTWLPICIGSDEEMENENRGIAKDEQFVRQDRNKSIFLTIPALGSALIQLDEIVDTYSAAIDSNVLVTGRFDLKLTLVNRGLISQQGTQIEPCYRGRLYCFVHNLSNKDISLKQGEAIASIEFSYVSCFCNAAKRKEIINSIIEKNKSEKRYLKSEHCDEGKGILNVRYFNRKKYLPDNCGLSHITDSAIAAVQDQSVIDKISNEVKQKIDKKYTLIIQILTAIVPIIVALIAFFSTILPIKDDCERLQKTVQNQQKTIEGYQEALSDLEEQLNNLENNTNSILNNNE